MERIRKESGKLSAERAALLKENGLGENYTEPRYMCDLCRDTGVAPDGSRCVCYAQRLKEAEEWQTRRKSES